MSEPLKITKLDHPAPATMAITPMAMLSQAVSSGAGIEVLERLMTLQERWQAGQARQAFDAAIAAAKQEIPVVSKNKKVDFTTQKGRTNYVYEDLGEVARTVDPILAKHGLSYRYRAQQDGATLTVTCIVSHRDGHSEETTLRAENDISGNKNSIQSIGSAATYLQRYTLKLALGLAAAKDDDAKASEPAKLITESQVDFLIEMADEIGADTMKLCQFFDIASFADIPTNKFDKVVAALEAKRKAAKGAQS